MVEVMPVPVSMPKCPKCPKCGDSPCYGHYSSVPMRVADAVASPVPSITIAEEFAKNAELLPAARDRIAKEVLINPEFVTHQWNHLKQVKQNRLKGVEKAKKTRAAKKNSR